MPPVSKTIWFLYITVITCASFGIGELYTSAGEGATAAMKGRLANKYFALAEEAWAQAE